jgi:hypothetical protein
LFDSRRVKYGIAAMIRIFSTKVRRTRAIFELWQRAFSAKEKTMRLAGAQPIPLCCSGGSTNHKVQ